MNNTNSNPSSLEVANTIHAQIGGRQAFMMMGAKNVLGDVDSLQFKVGRAPKYTKTVLSAHPGAYADMLKPLIEDNTGLYLSL